MILLENGKPSAKHRLIQNNFYYGDFYAQRDEDRHVSPVDDKMPVVPSKPTHQADRPYQGQIAFLEGYANQ
jgi:hypothetical protein